jgi:hypothetical protein
MSFESLSLLHLVALNWNHVAQRISVVSDPESIAERHNFNDSAFQYCDPPLANTTSSTSRGASSGVRRVEFAAVGHSARALNRMVIDISPLVGAGTQALIRNEGDGFMTAVAPSEVENGQAIPWVALDGQPDHESLAAFLSKLAAILNDRPACCLGRINSSFPFLSDDQVLRLLDIAVQRNMVYAKCAAVTVKKTGPFAKNVTSGVGEMRYFLNQRLAETVGGGTEEFV